MDKYIDRYCNLLKDQYIKLIRMKNMCPCMIRNKELYEKDITRVYNDIWKIIHEFAINLPIKYEFEGGHSKKRVRLFYTEKVSQIPCITCKTHYISYITNHSINNIKNSKELIEWTFNLHNDVNKRTNKKVLSLDDISKIYKINC